MKRSHILHRQILLSIVIKKINKMLGTLTKLMFLVDPDQAPITKEDQYVLN
jgi:hypothetical protein